MKFLPLKRRDLGQVAPTVLAGGIAAAWVGSVVALSFSMAGTAPERKEFEPGAAAVAANWGMPAGVGGAAGPVSAAGETEAPRFTHLRIDARTGRSLFAGQAPAYHVVEVFANQRVIARTVANSRGRWALATSSKLDASEVAFELEARQPRGANVLTGAVVRVALPASYEAPLEITFPGFQQSFQLAAVRSESEDIGSAASRRFNEIMRDIRRDGGERVAQEDDSDRPAERTRGERSGDLLSPAWGWLMDANRSYQSQIVPRLRRGGGFDIDVEEDQRQRADRSESDVARPATRRRQPGEGLLPDWGADGFSGWLEAARKSYTREIVPRLTGEEKQVAARTPTIDANEDERRAEAARRAEIERRAEAERRRLERERAEEAARKADRERIEAERRRRDAERQREAAERERRELEADARAREEAQRQARLREEEERRRQAAIDRATAEREAAERERREALRRQEEQASRRAEAQEEARRRRQAVAEAEKRRREDEADRARRVAEVERREREEADQRRRAAEAERMRLAELKQQEDERRRLQEARQRREEADRERRAAIAREEAERRRQREAEQRRREQLAAERAERRGRTPPLPTYREVRETRTALRIPGLPERRPRLAKAEETTSPSRRVARLDNKRRLTAGERRRRNLRRFRGRRSSSRSRCRRRNGRSVRTPGVYVVRCGDTLWDISRRHYRKGHRYWRIYRANRRKIARPGLIYPGQRFYLPRRYRRAARARRR